jgi:hypothetical protein
LLGQPVTKYVSFSSVSFLKGVSFSSGSFSTSDIENPKFWSRRGKILVKKKHTPVCEIENPELWSCRGKILVKKKHTPVCEIENPEFCPVAVKFR